MTEQRESLLDDFSYQTAKIYGIRGFIIKGARFGSERAQWGGSLNPQCLILPYDLIRGVAYWHHLSFIHSPNSTRMLKRDSETSTGFQSSRVGETLRGDCTEEASSTLRKRRLNKTRQICHRTWCWTGQPLGDFGFQEAKILTSRWP